MDGSGARKKKERKELIEVSKVMQQNNYTSEVERGVVGVNRCGVCDMGVEGGKW